MANEFELNFNIKTEGKTKAQIKAWAEGLTVWDLYQLSKTDDRITFSIMRPEETTETTYVPDDLEG